MEYFKSGLFLGYPIDKSHSNKLQSLSPHMLNFFVNDQANYLYKVVFKENLYYGKFVDEFSDIMTLELLEKNIYSLLKRIEPGFPFENTPLTLFPIQSPQN